MVGRDTGTAGGGCSDMSFLQADLKLFLAAGVIVGINVVELNGCHAMDLDYDFTARLDVVVHVRIEIGKAAGWKAHHGSLLEVVAHADFERTRDYGYVLALGVPVGRDAVSVGHFQADGVVTSGGEWIAFEDGELRTWRDE